jgi:DNA modification methylase
MSVNELYCGDNLEILREYIESESVDLIYLDPPFKSDQNYNLLFREKDGSKSSSQILAFEDTWEWNLEAEKNFTLVAEKGWKLGELLLLFQALLGSTDMLAYLAMMAPRLEELKRVLTSTGSIYLHCDPTASHYLKLLMDAVFGPQNFINEITWKRSQTRSSISQSFRRAHDVILFYSRSDKHQFNLQYKALSAASLKLYANEDERGRYQAVPLLVSGKRNGETGNIWRGIDPNTKGKAGMHWVTLPTKLEQYDKQKLVLWPAKKGGSPRLKYYLEQSPGVPLDDFWGDIDLISSSSKESVHYPTQKPIELLKRIIAASSNEGDAVLDPFCGCGTAIEAACSPKLKRRWIGIDLTKLAIDVVRNRLQKIGEEKGKTYATIWEPRDLSTAETLAAEDPYQFQEWFVRKLGGVCTGRGADRGIDGRLYFKDQPNAPLRQVIVSVKSGRVTPAFVRELHGTMNREKAAMGILATLTEPSKAMERDAASCGVYKSLLGVFPRIQILTVAQILGGNHENNIPPIQKIETGQRRPRSVPGLQISLPGIASLQ